MNITVSTPAGDMGAGGQPRYVVAYTLKQTPEPPPPPTQQKQPDILNPDSLQSIKDVTKLKSPTSPNNGLGLSGNSDYNTMYSSLSTQAGPPSLHDHTDGITIDNTILESTYPDHHHNFFIQPPHYSILGNSEPPHEYTKSYSTIIVSSTATTSSSSTTTPYQTHTNTNQIPIDYSRLLNNGDVIDPNNLLITNSNSNSNILLRNNYSSSAATNNEYRYSGSDFSMNESNTSTLGSKSNSRINNSNNASNRSHIITDTLPGPESCV